MIFVLRDRQLLIKTTWLQFFQQKIPTFQKAGKRNRLQRENLKKKNYFSVVGNTEVLRFEGNHTNKSN